MNLFSIIKDQVFIVDVVNDYTSLKKAGASYWKGKCPFHNEKTGSFTVSPDKGIFYCFGCHASGDVIAFIAQIEHLSQLQAAQHLIDRYHLQIPEKILQQAHTSQTTPQEKDNYFELCHAIAMWCHQNLQKNKIAMHYLEKRNIDQSMINRFTLGYFPQGSAALKELLQHAALHKAVMQDLIHAGIVFESKQGLFSPFEQRIIFPIYDHLGRCCGFGGRVFLPNDERPKYYNSKENEFFQKGTLLFGFDKAKKDIQATNSAILVEGYTDCIAMHKYGYTNTIATLGTACTLEHLKLLQRYAHQLIAMYDGDQAGQKAMLRLAELCWNVNIDIKILALPAQDDPASYLEKQGSIPMNNQTLQDIFSFFLQAMAQNYAHQNLKEKMLATSPILELIQKIQDPLKKDILLLQASEKLQIPLEILRKMYTKNKGTLLTVEEIKISSNDISLGAIPVLEQRLFSAVLHNIALTKTYDIKSLLPTMQNPVRGILERIIEETPHADTLDTILSQFSTHEQAVIHRLLCEYPQQDTESFEQILDQFHKKHWKSIILHIKMKLVQAQQTNNKQETEQLLLQFQSLKEKFLKYGRLY